MRKIATLTLIFGAIIFSVQTQAQKIRHVSLDSVIKAMPESDSAKKQYSNYAGQLQAQFQSFQDEFQKKYNDYMANQASYTGIIKQTKQKELQDMQERIQEFQQTAQLSLQKFGDSIQKPVIIKAKAAISAVAKEGQYKYILDTGAASFVLYSEEGDDVYDAVIKKLGIKAKAVTAPKNGGK